MNIDLIKKELRENLNKPVKIKVYGMRNKTSEYSGIISHIYPNIFTIITDGIEKSFNYRDIITGDIKLKYN